MFIDNRDSDRNPLTKKEKIFILLVSLVFVFMMTMEIASNYEPRKLGALLFLLFWIPLLFVHEFGHALMAALLGWKVTRIVIGVGKKFSSIRLGRTPMEIRMIPLEGFVQIAPRHLGWVRLKHALIYFAGPGIELLVFFAILGYMGGWGAMFSVADEYLHITLQSLAFAALAGAVINLIPLSILTAQGSTPNDGMGILLCLITSDLDYENWIREARQPDA